MTPENKVKFVDLLIGEETKLIAFAKKEGFDVDKAFRNYSLNFQSVEHTSCLRACLLASFCGALIFYLDNKYGECSTYSNTVQHRMNVMLKLIETIQY